MGVWMQLAQPDKHTLTWTLHSFMLNNPLFCAYFQWGIAKNCSSGLVFFLKTSNNVDLIRIAARSDFTECSKPSVYI